MQVQQDPATPTARDKRRAALEKEFGRAMNRLTSYIKKYHSGIDKEFRNMDKDSDGSLTVQELRTGFDKLGVPISQDTWEVIVGTIDDDDSGAIELPELMDTFRRWCKGGWQAVENKHGSSVRESAVARQEYFENEAAHQRWDFPDFDVLTQESTRRKRFEYGTKVQQRRKRRPLNTYDHEAIGGRSLLLSQVGLGKPPSPSTPRARLHTPRLRAPVPPSFPAQGRRPLSARTSRSDSSSGTPRLTQQQRTWRLFKGYSAVHEQPFEIWKELEAPQPEPPNDGFQAFRREG